MPVGANADSRSKKIVAHIGRLQDALAEVFIRPQAKQAVPQEVPQELVIGFDATDDPVHGDPWGRFFPRDDKRDCFLPPSAFCGGWPLAAILRPSNIDAAAGTVTQLRRIVPPLRAAWPDVRIVIRGDSGRRGRFCRSKMPPHRSTMIDLSGGRSFRPWRCREPIMRWCEEHQVDYLFGPAKNKRLIRAPGKELHKSQPQFEQRRRSGFA